MLLTGPPYPWRTLLTPRVDQPAHAPLGLRTLLLDGGGAFPLGVHHVRVGLVVAGAFKVRVGNGVALLVQPHIGITGRCGRRLHDLLLADRPVPLRAKFRSCVSSVAWTDGVSDGSVMDIWCSCSVSPWGGVPSAWRFMNRARPVRVSSPNAA